MMEKSDMFLDKSKDPLKINLNLLRNNKTTRHRNSQTSQEETSSKTCWNHKTCLIKERKMMNSKKEEEEIKEVEEEIHTRGDLFQDKIMIVKTSMKKEETQTKTGNMAIRLISHSEVVKSTSQSTDLNINLII